MTHTPSAKPEGARESAPASNMAFAARIFNDSEAQPEPSSPRPVDARPVIDTPAPRPPIRAAVQPSIVIKPAVREEGMIEAAAPRQPLPAFPALHAPQALYAQPSAPQHSAERVPPPPPQEPAPVAAALDTIVEPARRPQTPTNEIRVRVPEAGGGTTDVRFVENRGEVRVSVRTADPEAASALRGGLHELSGRLAETGIHAELWRPGSNASYSQHNSPQDPTDPDGRSRHEGSGSGSRQDQRQQERPAWVEELEATGVIASK